VKTVYTVNQIIRSVIKKEKKDSRTQRFLYCSPTKWATFSPSHTVRISLKQMINWSSLQQLPTARQHCTCSNHCWTYSRSRNHTESTVRLKNSLAEIHSKSQLYRVHCITQKRLTTTRSRPLLNPQQNKKPHRNLLCVSRTPLLKPTASHSYTELTV